MHAPIRRALAFAIDWLLANLVGAILLLPVLYLAENPAKVVFVATPPLVSFAMLFIAMASRGTTPGKRWLKLQVVGDGCIVCREVRRLGPVLLFGIIGLAELLWPKAPTLIWAVIALWVFLGYVLPLIRGSSEFQHNSATGFQVYNRDAA